MNIKIFKKGEAETEEPIQSAPTRPSMRSEVNFARAEAQSRPMPQSAPVQAAVQAAKVVDVSSFSKIINFCLVGLVFLLPLIFLPFTTEIREFNKQALLFFGVTIMLGVWVIRILAVRGVSWVKTSLDYILFGYLLIYLVSSWFSIDRASSFLGYPGRYTGSFISVAAFVVLYFLVVNNVRGEKLLSRLTKLLTVSIGIVMVYELFQILGLYILRFNYAKDRLFNPVGSSSVSMAVFMAVSLVFIQWLWLSNKNASRVQKVIYGVLTVIGAVVMFLINAFIGWLILGLGMVVLLALNMALTAKEQTSAVWFWKPLLLLVVSILFVSFQFLPSSINPRNLVTKVQLPVEIQLSSSATWSTVKNSITSSARQAILGSGPGTTGLVFGNIKPLELNKTVVWSLSFDRSSNELANILIENGLLGFLAFEGLSVMFLLYGLFFLIRKTDHPGRNYSLGFYSLWATLYFAHFFYFFNTTFYFLFWLSMALFMAIAQWQNQDSETKSVSFSTSSRSALTWMFTSLLVLAVLMVGAFFEIAVYGAEMAYASGIRELNKQQPNFTEVSNSFSRAIRLNPYRDTYYMAYAQSLIYMASEEAAKEKPDVQKINNMVSAVITAGQSAVNLSPAKAANWSALAQYYTNIRPLVTGMDKFIIENWTNAITRDRNNPALYVQLARAYETASDIIDASITGTGADADNDGLSDAQETKFGTDAHNSDSNGNGVQDGEEIKAGYNAAGAGTLTADQLSTYMKVDQAKLKLAEDNLKKAIEIKSDLADAYVEMARVYEKGGNLDAAKKELDTASSKFPNNADVRFEQGRIAYNQKNYSEAEKIFNRVLELQPKHANAMYSLALVYLQKEDKTKALSTLEKVRELVGPNVELEKVIKTLKDDLNTPAAPSTKK